MTCCLQQQLCRLIYRHIFQDIQGDMTIQLIIMCHSDTVKSKSSTTLIIQTKRSFLLSKLLEYLWTIDFAGEPERTNILLYQDIQKSSTSQMDCNESARKAWKIKYDYSQAFLVVQWLRLQDPNIGNKGLIFVRN